MKIVVVADAHIRKDNKTYRDLMVFLEKVEASSPDLLLLMGDIFDFYCDSIKNITPEIEKVIERLSLLGKKFPVVFIEGNHEFGGRIPEVDIFRRGFVLITSRGKKFYFTHGDELSSFNPLFPFIRAAFHSPFLATIFCPLVPVKILRKIAFRLSDKSRANSRVAGDIINCRWRKILITLTEYDILVTAHSHTPSMCRLHNRFCINIGSWDNQRSYSLISEEKIQVKKWKEKSRKL